VQVKISARHGHLGETTHNAIRERANKITHFFDRITMIEVTVDLSSELEKACEILVNAEHKHDFVAHEKHAELLGAVDLAIHKIERQLTRYKEKIQDHRRDQHVGEIGSPGMG